MEVSDDIAKKRKVDFQLRKLAAGGSGGRIRRSCVTGDNSQAPFSSQWKFETPVGNRKRPSCCTSETPLLLCQETSPCDNLQATPPSCRNIILPRDDLKSCIEENFICGTCASNNFYNALGKVLDHLATDLDLSPGQSVARSYVSFVRKLAKEGKSLYEQERIKVSFANHGLAGCMQTRCTMKHKRFKGHKTRCGQVAKQALQIDNTNDVCRYDINLKSVIGTHLMGVGHTDVQKIFNFIDVPYMTYNSFKRCEKIVGEKGIEVISMQVREEALKEEIKLTKKTYSTEEYGIKPALTVSLDMGWQKRSSG